jgi:ATP-dependent protease ClpP protease subunit
MGSCFSAATLILCAGQERRIVSSGRVMAHAPISFCGGTPTELRAAADNLDQTRATMAAILKTCCAPALVEKWLSTGDHYMTATEALACGLVTKICDPEPFPTMT